MAGLLSCYADFVIIVQHWVVVTDARQYAAGQCSQCWDSPSANLVQLHFWFCTGCISTSAPPAEVHQASGATRFFYWCRVEAWWCTGVRGCVAEYTGEQPAPSAASKAGAAQGGGTPKQP